MNSPAKGAGKEKLARGGADGGRRRAATTEKKAPNEKSARPETPAKKAPERAVRKAVRTARKPKESGSQQSSTMRSVGTGRSGTGSGGGQRSRARTPQGLPSTEENRVAAGASHAQTRSPSAPSPRPGPRPMFRASGLSEPRWDALELPDQKAQLKRYYHGARMPSPMGGFLEPLRVRTESDGSGTVILECSASSLRFALAIPVTTRSEKRKIKKSQADGNDPTCPRHDPPQWLNRVGPYLVCPLCGVRYGRA